MSVGRAPSVLPSPACERLDDVTRGRQVQLFFEGEPLLAYEGESLAVALLVAGVRAYRETAQRAEPRGPYCGIGLCFECVVTVDGRPNTRSCRTPVREGMQVRRQAGFGEWELP